MFGLYCFFSNASTRIIKKGNSIKALMFHVFVNEINFCFLYLPVFGPMQLPSHLVTTTM